MKIDEIVVKLEACRDHGPHLHELVYQLARAIREELAAFRDYKSSNPTSGPPTTATSPSIRLTFELSQEPELPDQCVGRCVELDVYSAGMSPLRTLEATAEAVRMVVENYKDSVNTQGSELTIVDVIAAIAEIAKR